MLLGRVVPGWRLEPPEAAALPAACGRLHSCEAGIHKGPTNVASPGSKGGRGGGPTPRRRSMALSETRHKSNCNCAWLAQASRLALLLVRSLLVLVPLLALSPAAFAEAGTSRRTVRVAAFQAPPFLFWNHPQTYQGVYADLLEHIAEELNWEVEYVPGSWADGVQATRRGTVDLLPCTALMPGWRRFLVYSRENVATTWGQACVPRNARVENILDIEGKTIAVVRNEPNGIRFHERCRQWKIGCRFIQRASYEAVLASVAQGNADVGIVHHHLARQYAHKYDLKPSSLIFSPYNMLFATPRGENRTLLTAVDRQIWEMKRNPQSIYYESLQRWMGSPGNVSLPDWVGWLAVATAAAALLLLIWNKALKREVSRRSNALVRSERRYRTLYSCMQEGLAIYQLIRDRSDVPRDYRILDVNPAFERIVGVSRKNAVGKTGRELYGMKVPPLLKRFTDVVTRGGGTTFETYFEPLNKDLRVSAFTTGPDRLATVFSDVTDRKQTEQALRSSEENLAIILRSIADAVIATDAEGRVTRMNPVAEELTGWPQRDATGRPLQDIVRIVNKDTREAVPCSADYVLKGQHPMDLPLHALLIARDGVERQISDSASPMFNDKGKIIGVVLVFRDVTEQAHLEEQFRQSQKMESIGRLAGGVAHDFNNLLAGIMGFAELLRNWLPEDNANAQQSADAIIETSERAAELTAKLLAFSRKAKLRSVPLDIHHVIDQVVELLKHTIDRRIDIKRDFDADMSLVTGDPTQLENAVLNLAVNARDAMPEGGTLRFATRIRELSDGDCRAQPFPVTPGQYLEICVADTGVGMDKQTVEHVFEPFFTTKEVGKGTGLGLAAVYGIVEDHHGLVELQSTPGDGSTFRICLPLPKPTAPASSEAAPESHVIVKGTGCVLLVDDEDFFRDMAGQMLRRFGYDVITAADGEEALNIFRSQYRSIDVVILDMVMPKLNGRDTYVAMKEVYPEFKAIISSGFTLGRETTELLREEGVEFLQKPYRAAALSQKVAAVLEDELPQA